MAKADDATRTRIENDLRTISSCTADTVAELNDLLLVKSSETSQKENPRAIKADTAPTTSRRRAGATVKTTTNGAKHTVPTLTPRERYILATQVANTTLRTLSEALKSQPSVRPRTSAKASSTTAAHPLNEVSVSQVVNSPQKRSPPHRSSNNASGVKDGSIQGLTHTAECARIAFGYLGTPEAAKVAGKDSPELQLENGQVALVGKLVAHGLDNLAIKEMRLLKRRLDKYIGRSPGNQGSRVVAAKSTSQSSPPSDRESLASLLDFGEVGKTNAALPIIINLQTYALRVIARTNRPRIIETAWIYIKLSHPSSPANLVEHIAESPNNSTKAARQLESLAGTILSLCPSISTSHDHEDNQPTPEVCLKLQHLAFRIRQRWWALVNHQGDTEKEILEPFAKCMVSYSRRSKQAPEKKYKLGESLYANILETVKEAGYVQKQGTVSQELVKKSLSSLAQAAGLHEEAIRWLGKANSSGSEKSAAKEAARLARLCILSLDACIRNPEKATIDINFDAVVAALSGSLGGTVTELDALSLEVHGLRRMATRLLSTLISAANDSPLLCLERDCFRLLSVSIHFTSRFLSTIPAPDTNTKITARRQERLHITFNMVKSIVDSVMAGCKRPIDSESTWMELDALVQDCVRLIHRLQELAPDNETWNYTQQTATRSVFVRFSNAYWVMHSQLRRLCVQPTVSIVPLQRSSEILSPRPLIEQEAGLLGTKLERLGEVYEQINAIEQSRDALLHSLQLVCNKDVTKTLSEAAAKHPVSRIFEAHSSLGTLKRLLSTYHKSTTKYGLRAHGELTFFDDSEQPASVRGILLEWQLLQYRKALSRNRIWDSDLNESLQTIISRLLDIYTPEEFPIRRRRLQLALFELAQIRPDIVSEASMQSDGLLGNLCQLEDTEDADLARFARHLESSCKLKLSLQSDTPQIAIIRESFLVWESLVNSTTSWDGLLDYIDDVDNWLQTMHMCVDFLAAKGEEYECLPILKLLTKVLELQSELDPSDLIIALSNLGVQLSRLGYTGKAGLVFARAETILSQNAVSTEAQLQWHIGYAEYLVTINNVVKSGNVLASAHAIAANDIHFMDLAKSSATLSGRLQFNRTLANACYVSSLLSAQLGNFKDAAKHARQSVMLNRRIWATLESKTNAKKAMANDSTNSALEASGSSGFDALSSLRNGQGVPLAMSVTHDALRGAEFWSLVPSLYRALMQHARILINQGLLQEAIYVAEQADKIVTATQSTSLIIENASRRAEYWIQSGRIDKAQPIVDALDPSQCGNSLAKIAYYSSIARIKYQSQLSDETMEGSSSNRDNELVTYELMEEMLATLTSPKYIKTIDVFGSDLDSLANDMAAMNIGSTEVTEVRSSRTARGRQIPRRVATKTATKTIPRTTRTTTVKSTSTTVSTKTTKAATTQAVDKTSVRDECAPLSIIANEITHRKALSLLLRNDISTALTILNKAESLKDTLDYNGLRAWTTFKAMFSKAIKDVEDDFTFNTLPESTIAFPALPPGGELSPQGHVAKKTPATKSTARTAKEKKQQESEFVQTLHSARECLKNTHDICATAGSSHAFQQISAALGHVTTLLSAVSAAGPVRGSLGSLYAAYMSEIPKCKSLMFAQDSVEIEQESMTREQCLEWPVPDAERSCLASVVDFQQDYINIIPESWMAISLALNDDQSELYITRFESNQDPFVLRLPMARQSSREGDEVEFTFADGRREFEEIIELSDFSTRSAKDMTTKEARRQWWSEREALDTKLRELLLNIENIWLGGFKGIFSHQVPQEKLLARFQASLQNILNRHLPSRRKKGQQKDLKLNPRVLSLFIGLSDASNEDGDLDEALADLLYFVVDILQFNGERNAYDEIDFDSMVIETTDALRAFQSASQSACAVKEHTILILDKNLHMLPWESLPYLEKLSISRLPSLAALRERLLASRPTSTDCNTHPGHHISAAAGGTSILNPSGDLSHTVKTIKPRLTDMSGSWNHIVSRAPTEKEFEDALREQELVLYFGHGSGAQYVRSKAVRKLYLNGQTEGRPRPGCATTFLFGCSSVHLSDNGIYEPSGMLASYLTAGAPAVVGMLWDVTDKDCDRFAVKAGELWGLWPEPADEAVAVEPPPTVKKSKGKGRVAQLVQEVEIVRGSSSGKRGGRREGGSGMASATQKAENGSSKGVALDEAVRDARKECVLRYLNGAAAVVYGIPVYLD
ncbi:hypothetical protein DM02DRAFT_582400 [Periconia macrospinosa]|uniref:separase n=1 Tax=Periconia macrospinosa TaxID=97972 RepID=A0A2V1E7N1_9PLEO|nr:hypothetical protein DM02DRAFT_582400 [Periconia macrospinosa]